ncbi:hypothetical protein CEXT_783191 [Caerostris extrusa]|uniref:Uncharacterized protein n=1 Tax=Caerostris extrusa TaxID=172846 RepID=A0AAV4XZR0_CAEEX|nr:hypothetical protein CEXT_783191 [Caerostris extrusa]
MTVIDLTLRFLVTFGRPSGKLKNVKSFRDQILQQRTGTYQDHTFSTKINTTSQNWLTQPPSNPHKLKHSTRLLAKPRWWSIPTCLLGHIPYILLQRGADRGQFNLTSNFGTPLPSWTGQDRIVCLQ